MGVEVVITRARAQTGGFSGADRAECLQFVYVWYLIAIDVFEFHTGV